VLLSISPLILIQLALRGDFPVAKETGRSYPLLKRGIRSSLLALASEFQEERPQRSMDIWAIILLFAFMVGIMGWGMNLFVNGILWYCDWREGTEINWGMETFFTLAMPFTWLYTIFLIVVLYIR
jgi:hypothetical protein